MPELMRISPSLLKRPTLQVAKSLLGKILLTGKGKTRTSGMIVEVEAYHGALDQASHAFRGPTNRNRIMFEGPGGCYVYFIYGNHFCVNVVTERKGLGAAVLIRALEPIDGIKLMQARRGATTPLKHLTNGPGKLCQALGINITMLGENLCTSERIGLYNHKRSTSRSVVTAKRIGITKSVDLPWRFYLRENQWVSRR